MDLLAQYGDSSEDEDAANVEYNEFGKRKIKFSKRELKQRRQERKERNARGNSDDELVYRGSTIDKSDSEGDAGDENDKIDENTQETSTFYGTQERDYQGRSFLFPPLDVDIDFNKKVMKCYLPKKVIYRYKGHYNGTTALKMLPETGHLFLSGGNDNKVKIWDFYHERKCLRDYVGHSKPIKTIDFTADAKQMLSGSFDHSLKIWDTETGKVSKRVHLHSIPNSAEFRPTNSNEFVVGLSSSKIQHYDTRVSEKNGLVQVYDHHLSSILSVKYFPDGSRFISSSEDKTVRIWNNQVNIPIKQISDTTQHSMPYLGIHPERSYFCAQSMDNVIYTFGMKPKYKRHPNKKFSGHSSAGYGIGFTFSPDGRFLCSGDAKGGVYLWDWNSTNMLKSMNIPSKTPVTQVVWHPKETSKVLCSGPDGRIFVLD
ncbi:Pre-mRNA-processing factor 17 [Nakaseomyces bracarensis]|uniref:Pre-mRNA-processing factor 17 n=1 Tax=Nakaseomyces bracarensis TaxID=273131 RepID=A0ABR4P0I3_9SACH